MFGGPFNGGRDEDYRCRLVYEELARLTGCLLDLVNTNSHVLNTINMAFLIKYSNIPFRAPLCCLN